MGKKKKKNSNEVLEKYHLLITHLRQKYEEKKLVMCLGAGFNMPLGIPNWDNLVRIIAEDESVQGIDIYKNGVLSLTAKIQALYEKFKTEFRKTHQTTISEFLDDEIRNAWIEIIRKALYSEYTPGSERNHPYLNEYMEIIKNAPITINYNFDDTIERLFEEERKRDEVKNYETTWRPSMQFKRPDRVIYHPNGYIPFAAGPSSIGHFIFSEQSFQDQLIDTMRGHYSPLQYLFFNYTMLFTGFSLNDPTLRHMLRQNATINPGHFHYYIYYLGGKKGKAVLKDCEKDTIRDSYFETFNLITLFLDNAEIKELANYISLGTNDFLAQSEDCQKKISYKFYVSGTPGTGKTTALDNLMDFVIHNEWPSPIKEELNQQDNNLTKEQRKDLDKWVSNQFRIRNYEISRRAHANSCIQLIDRSPLDPICFIDKTKNARIKRAKELKKTYEGCTKLEDGQIIVLYAKKDSIYRRLNKRNPGKYDIRYIEKTLKNFNKLFSQNATYIDTTGTNIATMVKMLAHEIFFGNYKELELHKYLNNLCEANNDKGQ